MTDQRNATDLMQIHVGEMPRATLDDDIAIFSEIEARAEVAGRVCPTRDDELDVGFGITRLVHERYRVVPVPVWRDIRLLINIALGFLESADWLHFPRGTDKEIVGVARQGKRLTGDKACQRQKKLLHVRPIFQLPEARQKYRLPCNFVATRLHGRIGAMITQNSSLQPGKITHSRENSQSGRQNRTNQLKSAANYLILLYIIAIMVYAAIGYNAGQTLDTALRERLATMPCRTMIVGRKNWLLVSTDGCATPHGDTGGATLFIKGGWRLIRVVSGNAIVTGVPNRISIDIILDRIADQRAVVL